MTRPELLVYLFVLASIGTVSAGDVRRAAPNWLHSFCSWLGFCNEVCYGDLGCFDTSLNCHRDFFPPLSPEEINTYYEIHTRVDHVTATRANSTREALVEVLGDRRITFIIHGWGEGVWKQWVIDLRDALLEKEDLAVVLVDWSDGADSLNYLKAVQNMRVVGREVAMFIQLLQRYTGQPFDRFHLIGHSLGAHAAGFVGQSQPGLGRISALDAAGPSFEGTDPDCRLDETDALYVDAIHTDSSKLSEGGVGISQRVGHSDFYPNGGYAQPGCRWWMVGCSHARSHLYFIESVKLPQCRFSAIPCESEEDFAAGRCQSCGETGCKLMGYYTDTQHSNGSFFLSTRGHSPYCTKMKFYWRRFYLLRQKRHAVGSAQNRKNKERRFQSKNIVV
ncbi:inactive pancreatic lipase-related protein 1-like [Diadema setosum]|uniref:inactive pancreatic lipase-related protein 1-like n=1 Tax=Diadema setosum TaxID=31175 RepID=UPI003B3AD294